MNGEVPLNTPLIFRKWKGLVGYRLIKKPKKK